jgi:hypothetical protein
MKSALIFLLLIVCLGGAALSKPSEDDFKRFINSKASQQDSNLLQAGVDTVKADLFVQNCTFVNRIFWVNVQQNGHTIYTGAFAHFFNRAQISKVTNTIKGDLQQVEGQVKSVTQNH